MSRRRTRVEGYILTPRGFVDGAITFGDDGAAHGRITDIGGDVVAPADARRVREDARPIVLPGFIDLHVHGGAGHDIMEGGDSAARIAVMHARHGTTSLLATTMTAPAGDLEHAFAALAPLCASDTPAARARERGARVLGVHLEGPYINPGQLGAQPAFARAVSTDELATLSALAPIVLITLAPEVPGHMDGIAGLCAAGYRVQLGHSTASYEEGALALSRGARGFTHLFNAMSGMHHRKPGLVGAALAHAEYAEIIVDLLHVHPGAIRAALRAIPRLYCVTDSTAAAGMPDGDYQLGRQTVTKCLGGVRLADGTLAGSALTMDQALRNLVDALDLDLADAARRVSTYPADYIGVADRGRLEPGAWADVVVVDRDLKLTAVYAEGEAVSLDAA